MKLTLLPLLIGALPLTEACASQPIKSQSFGYAQTESGHWKTVNLEKLKDYQTAARVICGNNGSEIEVVWNSESGDWAAFDSYRSSGPFFTRVIRFAQFDDIITVSKLRPSSKPSIKIGGRNVQQYDYLLNELTIWPTRRNVPFGVPECAVQVFQESR